MFDDSDILAKRITFEKSFDNELEGTLKIDFAMAEYWSSISKLNSFSELSQLLFSLTKEIFIVPEDSSYTFEYKKRESVPPTGMNSVSWDGTQLRVFSDVSHVEM